MVGRKSEMFGISKNKVNYQRESVSLICIGTHFIVVYSRHLVRRWYGDEVKLKGIVNPCGRSRASQQNYD